MNAIAILGHNIRLKDKLFSLNDLHKASGSLPKHQPNRFLRLDTTQELINEMASYPDLGSTHEVQNGKGTWVCKELVYAYAMWISAKFHLQVIRAFDALVNRKLVTLSSEQKCKIKAAIGARAKNQGEHYQSLFSALNRHFRVSEYADILAVDFEEALKFVQTVELPNYKKELPVVCMRIMTTIENGVVTNSSAVPNDAYVVTKGRLANLLSEPGVFSLEEMAKIAETVNRRMVELAMSAGRMLTVK
ncbi:KilA-N domain-containing protein [Vibrio cholerae]|nr:KilA-N domain-containing protein [Vibrio cholerae]